MVERGPYSEFEASRHVAKIGHALKYLHSKGIVHRDLKPENLILVDKTDDSDLKIADFGLSKMVDDIENATMQTVCGTWAYAAPEVKTSLMSSSDASKASYTAKVDLWSTGVILFVVLAAYHPFDPDGEADDATLWRNICAGTFTFDDEAWNDISDGAKDLIRKLIVVDPNKRYGTEELLNHPWVCRSTTPVPKTPITPAIDHNLRAFQETKSRKYVGQTPKSSIGSSVFSGQSLEMLSHPFDPHSSRVSRRSDGGSSGAMTDSK